MEPVWRLLSGIVHRRPAVVITGVGLVLLVAGGWKARQVEIGDLHAVFRVARGLPLQHRQRRDHNHFSIGVDVLS